MTCYACKNPAIFSCGLCSHELCKSCAEFINDADLTYYKTLPPVLSHGQYCSRCFAGEVIPALQTFRSTLKKAKKVYIVDKPSRRALPILRKLEKPLTVSGCVDREDAFMRLAFQAVEKGFNAVVKANVEYKKVRNFGYQKMMWEGTGYAAELDSRVHEMRNE